MISLLDSLEGDLNELTRPIMDGKFIGQSVERREWQALSWSGRVGSTTLHGGFLAPEASWIDLLIENALWTET